MYNKVILVGRLTRDIELRYTQGGMAVANTAIATNHNYSSNGEKKEEVCYTDITFFARSAEIANQYLRKGSQILVEGRLKFDKWVDQSGQNRSKHSVVVETMKMLDSKGDNQGGGYQAPAQNNSAQSYNQPQGQQQTQSYQQQQPSYGNNEPRQQQSYQQQASTQSRQMPSSDSVPVIDIDEDEIPF
nr:single-stranded DNA-binding protein [uncultured Sulfurimonas sp.]